jgi:hypothetical protein
MDILSLRAMDTWDIPALIPVDGEATIQDLSAKCGLNEVDLQRLILHAATNHVFRETEEGKIAHTAASQVLLEEKAVRDTVGQLHEWGPGSIHVCSSPRS